MSNKIEEKQPTNNSPEDVEVEKKYSKIQWFFACFVVPLLFSVVVSLVVMSMAGINVFHLAEKYKDKIPDVTSLVNHDEKTSAPTERITSLNATIKQQKQEIAKLKTEIESKLKDLKGSKEEIDLLTKQLESLQEKQVTATVKLEELAKVYETMSAKKSAAIFSKMDNKDVIEILVNMNNEARAAVLEKMDPVKAAKLTVLLKDEVEKGNAEINNG